MKKMIISGIEPEYLDKLKDFLTEVINVNGQFAEYLAVNGVQITQPELNQIQIEAKEPAIIPDSLDQIAANVVNNKQGFTVNEYLKAPSKRFKYFISLIGHEQKIEIRGKGTALIRELIDEYMESKSEMLKSPNCFLGGWVNGGYLYLDISEGFNERYKPEAIKDIAKERGQKAYYNYWESKAVFID